MTADQFVDAIVSHHLKITPVLDGDGCLCFWSAGTRRIAGNGWTNITPLNEQTKGSTPQEAVQKLLKILNKKK